MHTALQQLARPDEREQPLLDGAVGTESKSDRTTDDERSLQETHPSEQRHDVRARDEDLGGVQENSLPALARVFLDKLLRLQLLNPDVAGSFLKENVGRLSTYTTAQELGNALVAGRLLTQYQLDRVMAGTIHGLVFGNHRVLGRLGAGGMGVVFRAEHMFMKRQVAIKVLPVDDDCSPALLSRFYSEMQVLAGLHHPNIVTAFDSGHVPSPGPGLPSLLYLAMELVEGGDLENYVRKHGSLDVGTACGWVAQAACGLQEAHDHHLIHRDIKPSNLLLSRHGQIKIVDFGLVQQFSARQTSLGAILGTIEFMPPEQSQDSSSVGVAADIYGLGATLFWLLTSQPPHPPTRSAREAVMNLQQNPARLLRSLRPDAPPELEAFVQTMLERDPARRPALPLTVSRILAAFADSQTQFGNQTNASNPVVPH
jgi:hypothetical protein